VLIVERVRVIGRERKTELIVEEVGERWTISGGGGNSRDGNISISIFWDAKNTWWREC